MSKTVGTIESYLLQDVIKAGFKPISISLSDSEEVFVFKSSEDARDAEDYFSPEGIWVDEEGLSSLSLECEVTELGEIALLIPEDRAIHLTEMKAKQREIEKQEKLKTLPDAIAAALKDAPKPPEIRMAKSCETCDNCNAYLKDAVRLCRKNGEYVTGSAVCDDWELRKKLTKGGTLRFNDGKNKRNEGNKFIECHATIEHIGEITLVEGRTLLKLIVDGDSVLLSQRWSDEEIQRHKDRGTDISRYDKEGYIKWSRPRSMNKNQVIRYSNSILKPSKWK